MSNNIPKARTKALPTSGLHFPLPRLLCTVSMQIFTCGKTPTARHAAMRPRGHAAPLTYTAPVYLHAVRRSIRPNGIISRKHFNKLIAHNNTYSNICTYVIINCYSVFTNSIKTTSTANLPHRQSPYLNKPFQRYKSFNAIIFNSSLQLN